MGGGYWTDLFTYLKAFCACKFVHNYKFTQKCYVRLRFCMTSVTLQWAMWLLTGDLGVNSIPNRSLHLNVRVLKLHTINFYAKLRFCIPGVTLQWAMWLFIGALGFNSSPHTMMFIKKV